MGLPRPPGAQPAALRRDDTAVAAPHIRAGANRPQPEGVISHKLRRTATVTAGHVIGRIISCAVKQRVQIAVKLWIASSRTTAAIGLLFGQISREGSTCKA